MRVHRSIPLRLEIMEEKLLLSSGIGKPAAAAAIVAIKTAKLFSFNGKLPLKLTATFDQAIGATTYTEVTPGFREKKLFTPMGEKVKVSGSLAYPGSTSSNGLPNLSGSTFELTNASGSLAVTLSSSRTNVYAFTVSGGTKRLVRADGTTGTALFGAVKKTGFALTFKTTGHGTQSPYPPITGTAVTLASFDGSSSGTTGGNPSSGVTLDSQGNLYGTTSNGGGNGDGTVYEIAKGSHTLTTIASFDGTNGSYPDAGVTIDAQGNLYGTTQLGGPGDMSTGLGTVWEIAKGTGTITTLASFDVATGYEPRDGVAMDAQGDLYGTAYYGGLDSLGTVWELAKGSSTISTIASFNGTNGEYPYYGVTLDAQGNLYGAAGSLWEIVEGSNTITTLDARWSGPVTMDSQGNFYEAAFSGGTHEPYVQEFSRLANGTYAGTKAFAFSGISASASPSAVTIDAQGNLYGTIPYGGAYGDGMLWEIVKGSSSITTLASFDGTGGSGYSPKSGVALDADGNLYGTTFSGGADGFGTAWEFVVGAVPSARIM